MTHRCNIILTAILLLALAAPAARAQQSAPSAETAYALAVQHGKKLTLNSITPGQRRHLDTQIKINQARRSKRYTERQLFTVKYQHIAEEFNASIPEFLQTAQSWQEKCEEAFANGEPKQATAADNLAKLHRELARIGQEFLKEYKAGNGMPLNGLIREYVTCEGYFLMLKVKPPPRNWLTVEEARNLMVKMPRGR